MLLRDNQKILAYGKSVDMRKVSVHNRMIQEKDRNQLLLKTRHL